MNLSLPVALVHLSVYVLVREQRYLQLNMAATITCFNFIIIWSKQVEEYSLRTHLMQIKQASAVHK